MIKDYFEKQGNKTICKKPCELIIHNNNVEENADGNLDTFLFGTLLIVYDGKMLKSFTVTLGTRVVIPIYTSEQIIKHEDGEHISITFNEGDVIIDNDELSATIVNVYTLFNNILLGRLSSTIPREKYYTIMQNAMDTNVKLSFPKVLLEIMIAQLFMDDSGKELARLSSQENIVGLPISINDSVQMMNTYNSMTFEDPTKSILINLGKTGSEQIKDPSPLEKFMRM